MKLSEGDIFELKVERDEWHHFYVTGAVFDGRGLIDNEYTFREEQRGLGHSYCAPT